MKREFIELGGAIQSADPHGRMIGIHPMTSHGSVREFGVAPWMSFGDYQQNYHELHERILLSRPQNKPVVNSEYAYYLRDQNGDGVTDKENSTSLEAIRHATWDIVMAGGYVISGFGTTYFGGNREPGPFDLGADKNTPWAQQMGLVKRLFTSVPWWKLQPHDELVTCSTPRGKDRRELKQVAPPSVTYWCLAEPGRQYLVYARGLSAPVTLKVPDVSTLGHEQFNPRTGEFVRVLLARKGDGIEYRPPDEQDWVLVLRATEK